LVGIVGRVVTLAFLIFVELPVRIKVTAGAQSAQAEHGLSAG
jgi:hypothetical protein